MKTYKKISLLLLLSTTVAISAHNPLDDITELDGNGLPLPESELSSKPSVLEKMISELSSKPSVLEKTIKEEQPTQTTPTKQETTAQKREQERQQKTADTYLRDAYQALNSAMVRDTIIKRTEEALTKNQIALEKLTETKNFTKWEKIMGGGAVVVAFMAAVKEAPEVVWLAVLTGTGTLVNYGWRRRSYNVTEAALKTSKNKLEETMTTAKNDRQTYLASVETKLKELKSAQTSLPKDFQQRIDTLETDFATFIWNQTFPKA